MESENKAGFILLLLLAASLPFERFYSHVFLAAFAVNAVIRFRRGKISIADARRLPLLLVPLSLPLAALLFSSDTAHAVAETGRLSSIVISAAALLIDPPSARQKQTLFAVFAIVSSATVVYLFGEAFAAIRYYALPAGALFTKTFINHNFSAPIGIHATFLSMQLVVAFTLSLERVMHSRNRWQTTAFSACLVILAAGILQLGSKSILVALAASGVMSGVFLLRGRARAAYLASFAGVVGAVLVIVSSTAALRTRYVSELRTDLSGSSGNHLTDTRVDRWKAAAVLIGDRPLFGHGAGAEATLLHRLFFERRLYSSFVRDLNVHNEYLSLLLKYGLVGCGAFLAVILIALRWAVARRDAAFAAFVVTLAIVAVSENVFDVDKGVIFYAVFFPLFAFSGCTAHDNLITPVTVSLKKQLC